MIVADWSPPLFQATAFIHVETEQEGVGGINALVEFGDEYIMIYHEDDCSADALLGRPTGPHGASCAGPKAKPSRRSCPMPVASYHSQNGRSRGRAATLGDDLFIPHFADIGGSSAAYYSSSNIIHARQEASRAAASGGGAPVDGDSHDGRVRGRGSSRRHMAALL